MTAALQIEEHVTNTLINEIEHAVFRIAQEAITNAHKHGSATNVRIQIDDSGAVLKLTIQDNGVGFSSDNPQSGQFGLIGMRERASGVGGTLKIDSQPGQGVTILFTVPVTRP